MSVNQQQNLIVVSAGTRESSDREVGIVPVIDHVETAHTAQSVRQSAVAKLANLVGGNDGYGRGSLPALLYVHRCRVDLNSLEFLRTQVHDLVALSQSSRQRGDGNPQPEPNPGGASAPAVANPSPLWCQLHRRLPFKKSHRGTPICCKRTGDEIPLP